MAAFDRAHNASFVGVVAVTSHKRRFKVRRCAAWCCHARVATTGWRQGRVALHGAGGPLLKLAVLAPAHTHHDAHFHHQQRSDQVFFCLHLLPITHRRAPISHTTPIFDASSSLQQEDHRTVQVQVLSR